MAEYTFPVVWGDAEDQYRYRVEWRPNDKYYWALIVRDKDSRDHSEIIFDATADRVETDEEGVSWLVITGVLTVARIPEMADWLVDTLGEGEEYTVTMRLRREAVNGSITLSKA